MSTPATVVLDCGEASAPQLRGWGRYVRELAGALRACEDVRVVALRPARSGPELLWEQAGLPLAARRRRAAVLHSPNCFLPLRRPCAGVVTIHDLAFEYFPGDFAPRTRAKYRALVPRAARSAERVICPSRFTRDQVCERYGVDPARVRVIPLAPALAGRPPIAVSGAPYLLGIGDLRPKKNWRRLVRAWLALRAEGLEHRLVIAGVDAGEGAALRALAGDAPLSLPGYLPDAQLDATLAAAAALVHPSLHEGFGLVVLEAQARGVPVAAAAGSALPEAGGDAAVYFDPLDERAIAAAIARALEDADRLAGAGSGNAARFSWVRTALQTAAVYRELI